VTFSRPIIEIVPVAVINSAIAPLFVVRSPGQAAAGKVRSAWNSLKVRAVLAARRC
jgi:uncharacterized membrane protein